MRNPTRSGLFIVCYFVFALCFYVLPCACSIFRRAPRTVAAIEKTWHGPAHRYPQEYAMDYRP